MPALPYNQFCVLGQHWPESFAETFNPAHGYSLPPTWKVPADVLRKWFFRVSRWNISIGGGYSYHWNTFGTDFSTVFSGSLEIDNHVVAVESGIEGPITEPREIWRGLRYNGDRYYGHEIDQGMNGTGGLFSTTTVTSESDSVTHDPVSVGELRFLNFAVRDPDDSTFLYPGIGYLFNPGWSRQIGARFTTPLGAVTVGTLTVEGEYSIPITMPNASLSSISGSVAVALTPAAYFDYRDADGNNPRWEPDTGERIAGW